MKIIVYLGVLGLIALAVVLGGAIYQQQTNTKIPLISDVTDRTIPQNVTPSNNSGGNASTTTPTASAAPYTADEKAALAFPAANATAAEIQKHSDLVNKLGNQSAYPEVNITGCRAMPAVYRVKMGGTFKVRNNDAKDHEIYTAIKTTIKANTVQTVSASAIGSSLGNFGYGCDGSAGNVGIIQIVP